MKKTILDTHTDSSEMEMPCMCDCGEWFDLNDGYRSDRSNKVICGDCHRYEKREEQMRIICLDLECEHTSFDWARKELKRLGVASSHLKSKASIIQFGKQF